MTAHRSRIDSTSRTSARRLRKFIWFSPVIEGLTALKVAVNSRCCQSRKRMPAMHRDRDCFCDVTIVMCSARRLWRACRACRLFRPRAMPAKLPTIASVSRYRSGDTLMTPMGCVTLRLNQSYGNDINRRETFRHKVHECLFVRELAPNAC